MQSQTALQTNNTPIDPKAESTRLQKIAANPQFPVWVGASAGSGKTKVLVDRLLRLMLPADTHTACDPSRIMCITFTKAAAAEVLARITNVLSNWTIATQESLSTDLTDLLGAPPTPEQRDIARALFARVLDTPGGMKIMTIHSFCQSVLTRFPLEAGLPAGFGIMDDTTAANLMRDVRHNLILNKSQNPEFEAALDYLSTHQDSTALEDLMRIVFRERTRMHMMLQNFGSLQNIIHAIYETLGVDINNPQSSLQSTLNNISSDDLNTFITGITGTGKKTLDTMSAQLKQFQSNNDLNAFINALLTKEETRRKPINDIKNNPELLHIFERFQDIAIDCLDVQKNIQTAIASAAVMHFGMTALAAYDAKKRALNQFDFEDLITHTRALLSDGGVHWVQYKLDGGIDHILVDEAQDTNPDQWDIISALYGEFYDGNSQREDTIRTTFVVGDEKQSIYSFQGADPRIFDRQRQTLNEKTTARKIPQQNITLNASFRSGASILEFVDTVFAPALMRTGVLQQPDTQTVTHRAANSGMPGHVEIWPIIKNDEKRDKDTPPQAWEKDWVIPSGHPPTELAERIAKKIRHWLDTNEILESHNRPIRAGDILILLAKRHPMAEPILRALRAHNIPVTGIDRMVLAEQICIQDVLATLSFALNPDDDLTLATILKSPFIRMDEDTLFNLAHNRPSTLWDALRKSSFAHVSWFQSLIETASANTASTFLHHVLYHPCPASPISGMQALLSGLGHDAIDPLQELLARADAHLISPNTGLQDFLQSALSDTSQVKRQIDPTDDRVRLMTVHGSKGLEAPIVFLPDTLRRKTDETKADNLQFPAREDITSPPLWSPNSDTRAPALESLRAQTRLRSEEEYRRLLYVALTRPATRLYICAAQSSSDKAYTDQSWHHVCSAAMDAHPNVQTHAQDPKIRFIQNARTSDPKSDKSAPNQAAQHSALPDWVHTRAPEPDFPPKPLMPSRLTTEPEPAALSPLSGNNTHRFKRGNIIHALFQFLPDIDPKHRRERAFSYLSRPIHGLTPAQIDEIMQKTFNVLENPAYAPLFDANSRAEVALTGQLGNNIISAKIDRLRHDGNTITILDYKTNRPGAQTLADVPPAYKTQLRLYRDLLTNIYPNKDIKTLLLWTDGPVLMDLTLDL